jgi:hypothetical protein
LRDTIRVRDVDAEHRYCAGAIMPLDLPWDPMPTNAAADSFQPSRASESSTVKHA